MSLGQVLFGAWAALALAACSTSPRAVIEQAQAARRDRDQAAYLACFTDKSRRLLQNLRAVEDTTRKTLHYLSDPFVLLPEGPIEEPRSVEGNVAVVPVGSGKKRAEVVLLKEAGEWRIEALELPAFWEPLHDKEEP